MNAKELLVLLDRLTGQESQFCLDCMKSIEDDARGHYMKFGDGHAVLYYMPYEMNDFAGAIKVLQYLTREKPKKTKTTGVP